MKCPKCDYLSFEAGDRCRNCGYDFSLSANRPAAADVSLAAMDESLQPLDLTLAEPPRPTASEPAIDLDRLIGASGRAVPDLPLFATDRGEPDDRPLISASATPRAPLAVRRNVDISRLRATKPRDEPVELALELAPSGLDRYQERVKAEETSATIVSPGTQPAGWFRRAAAALIDTTILATTDALVIYFTVRLCGLTIADVSVLPIVPLVAFIVMLNGGYVIAFTAIGGQTIGKMATGIQVIGDDGPVDVTHAALRAAGYIVSLAPVGLGLVPALFGDGRRALHDRLADTRVVRA